MSETRNVLAMTKGDEQFVFVYDDNSLDALLETLARYAEDEDLNFTWEDAELLCRKLLPECTPLPAAFRGPDARRR